MNKIQFPTLNIQVYINSRHSMTDLTVFQKITFKFCMRGNMRECTVMRKTNKILRYTEWFHICKTCKIVLKCSSSEVKKELEYCDQFKVSAFQEGCKDSEKSYYKPVTIGLRKA